MARRSASALARLGPLALLVVLAACGSSASASPTRGDLATTSPSAIASSEDPAWDLVWFSDSSGPPADKWAERITASVGVDVRVHDFWGSGAGGSARTVLDMIESDSEIRQAVADAEVIGLNLNPAGTQAGETLGSVCIDSDPTPRDPPPVLTSDDFSEYADLLRGIYDRILELRDGEPTVIRAMNVYVPILPVWREVDIEAECTAGWEAWTSTELAVAAEYGVSGADVYAAFNGPNHDQDPNELGYIGPDGEHPSEAGNEAQLDLLDALGYELVSLVH